MRGDGDHMGWEISHHQCELAARLGAAHGIFWVSPRNPESNAIESLNYSIWNVLKSRGAFPTDESILKVLFLGMQQMAKKWTAPIPDWKRALNQFAMLLGERVPTI